MRDAEDEIRAAGAGIAAVGTGDLGYARRFAQQAGIGFPLLVDPDLESYRMVGARRAGIRESLRPAVVLGGLRAVRRGRRQGRIGPHPLTLGATHVIVPDGRVPFAWVNDDYADHAPLGEVVASLRRVEWGPASATGDPSP